MIRGTRSVPIAVLALLAGLAAPRADQGPFDPLPASPANRIDALTFARLRRTHIAPAGLASDAVFLRRVYLDVIGTLPTVDESRAFLDSRDPNKRRVLIDCLLARGEFADYWAMKWSETLRVKAEFPINLWPNAVQAYHRWIRASVRDNVPYDRFARALLTGSGSNFRVGPVNFYRAVQRRDPNTLAAAAALTFMGVRTERWPADRRAQLAFFFSQVGYKTTSEWKEEIVFFDPDQAPAGTRSHGVRVGTFPDGRTVRLAPDQDPREAFAAWLIAADNPWFAPAVVNRVWFWLLGRGVVHEPDDIRPDNPPANPELLAYLARALVASRYDLKSIYRLILNSTTYQLATQSAASTPEAEANFAHALVRPLEAEVLIDALCQITGIGEPYSSAIPEPYTFMPDGQRAIALADGSITSAFLVDFGRPPRDTGLATERSTRVTASQRLSLLNSTVVQRKLEQGPRLQALLQARGSASQLIEQIYLTILSRRPTDSERGIAAAHLQTPPANRRAATLDLIWALINSEEFLYRH
jgi:hypothetical protein